MPIFPQTCFLSPFQHLQAWGNNASRCCQRGAMTLARRIKPFPGHCSSGPLSLSCWGGCFSRMLHSKSLDMGENWAFWTVTSKLAPSFTNEGVHYPWTSIGIYPKLAWSSFEVSSNATWALYLKILLFSKNFLRFFWIISLKLSAGDRWDIEREMLLFVNWHTSPIPWHQDIWSSVCCSVQNQP